jgi:hypothetical protein
MTSTDTPLDRESWSYERCQACRARQAQLVIDLRPDNREGGLYERYCWLCYWEHYAWRRGPIVNCGPMWDGVDIRRQLQE